MGLVIGREINEYIMIGDSIKITITRIRGDQVRLLFDAPADVPIYRGELYRKLAAERREGRP